jgi:hypothetical protein
VPLKNRQVEPGNEHLLMFLVLFFSYSNPDRLEGHDSGLMVFKLERERPAYSVHQNVLFYVSNKYLKVHNFENGSDNPLLSLRRGTGPFVAPRSLSYNSAEHSVLLCMVRKALAFFVLFLSKAFRRLIR